MMEKNAKIYVAGHRGMVGSAIVRELQRQGYTNIVTRTHKELDLTRQDAVEKFFATEKPEYVFLAAAKVGGIVANQNALADFMYDNMILEMNVIHSAWKNGCRKLEFLGSSCIYPRMAPQPMKESCLLTSELEKTNEAYALAKISGLKYCEFLNRQYGTDYISVMPTNLYGPNDNYHPTHSHVLPALIRRFHEAKESGAASVTCWGDGSPLREFLYVDDLANLCVFLMNNYSGNETVNAGTGKELTIKELTELVAKVVGYNGEIKWDPDKPNGTPRKLLDVSKATNLGWTYDCGLCTKVCARRMQIERHSPIKCYAGQSRDAEKLKRSASGAAFQMLAEIVLETGGVCYGCAGEMINGEYRANHIRVTNVDELQSILNSKYILSHIGTTYQQIKKDLENGKLVLFGGTPCQALGLKSFLNHEYENLIIADVICHGVTSKTIFNDYLREIEKEQNIIITDYIFRDKKAGWGSNFCYSYYENGDKNKIKIKRFPKEGGSHEIHYLRGDISRENCFSCEMSNTNRVSDFTFGDYWAIEIEHPEFIVRNAPALSIRKGINCMMVNTEKGMQYLSKLQEKMVMYEVDLASITRHNSNLLKPSKRGKARDAVLENYYMEGYKKIEENYNDTVGKKRTVYAAKNMIKTHIPDKLRVQIYRMKFLRKLLSGE